MSTSTVRFGLVGFGAWGRHHAAAIVKTHGAQVVAIADSREGTLAASRMAHPDVDVVADYETVNPHRAPVKTAGGPSPCVWQHRSQSGRDGAWR